ncbi:acyl carrier protein, partial [Plantactinospora sp. B5E13]
LGGNSLQVIRVVNRLNNAFGTTLGVRDFYTAPNIATLANRIEENVLANLSQDDLAQLLDDEGDGRHG